MSTSPAPPMSLDEGAVADLYRSTFAPRTDTYAAWHRGEERWDRVRSELTPQVIWQALTHHEPGAAVSAYMEDREGRSHVGALDFDRDDGWTLGLKVAEIMESDGAHPAVERSRRGCHIWYVLDGEAISSEQLRAAERHWLWRVSPPAANDEKIEHYPKLIRSRGPDTVGYCLRMPMMPHQRTGKVSALYHANGERWGASVRETLGKFDLTPVDVVLGAASKNRMSYRDTVTPEYLRPPRREAGDVIPILADAGVNAIPGRSIRCPLHDDRSPSMVIARDAGRVWCKSPECVAYNNGRGLGPDQLAKALGQTA